MSAADRIALVERAMTTVDVPATVVMPAKNDAWNEYVPAADYIVKHPCEGNRVAYDHTNQANRFRADDVLVALKRDCAFVKLVAKLAIWSPTAVANLDTLARRSDNIRNRGI